MDITNASELMTYPIRNRHLKFSLKLTNLSQFQIIIKEDNVHSKLILPFSFSTPFPDLT